MASLNQQPSALSITGVAGGPFSLNVNFVSITNSIGASVAWTAVTDQTVLVTDQYGNAIASGVPSVISPANYQLLIDWTATQTALIANAQSPRWALQATVASVGPETLVSGPLSFVSPTYPAASSTTTSADLSVSIGTTTANLTVSVSGGSAGGGSIGLITSNDGTIDIADQFGPITDLSAAPAITTASVAAVAAAFTATQSASVAAITTAEGYALGVAQAASVNAAAVSDPLGSAAAGSVNAVAVSEAYAYGLTKAAALVPDASALRKHEGGPERSTSDSTAPTPPLASRRRGAFVPSDPGAVAAQWSLQRSLAAPALLPPFAFDHALAMMPPV